MCLRTAVYLEIRIFDEADNIPERVCDGPHADTTADLLHLRLLLRAKLHWGRGSFEHKR